MCESLEGNEVHSTSEGSIVCDDFLKDSLVVNYYSMLHLWSSMRSVWTSPISTGFQFTSCPLCVGLIVVGTALSYECSLKDSKLINLLFQSGSPYFFPSNPSPFLTSNLFRKRGTSFSTNVLFHNFSISTLDPFGGGWEIARLFGTNSAQVIIYVCVCP